MIDHEGIRQHIILSAECNRELAEQRDALLTALRDLATACHCADKSGCLDGLDAAYIKAGQVIARAEGKT